MKRRDFVKTTAATASGILLDHSFSIGKSGQNFLNIAVIGTGDRGQGLIKLLTQTEQVRVVACCDIIPFRLKEALVLVPEARGYEQFTDLLDHPNLDAVIVAVPFGLHEEVVLQTIAAGKHVFCEKTMVRGYDAIMRVILAVTKSGIIFQTGHQYHSSRLYKHVVELIKNGKVGDLTAIQCQWNRNGNWRRQVPDPRWERMINWRMYREYSGGLVAELSSYQIDFANWVLGEFPKKVMGSGGIDYWKDGRETFDNIHLIMEYPGGVRATYSCTTTNSLGDYQIKVLGKKGTLILDYARAWFIPEQSTEKEYSEVDGVSGATVAREEPAGYPIELSHKDPSLQALLDFRDSILNDKQPESDVITGGKTAAVVQMSLDAMYDNQIINALPRFTNL